MKTQIRLNSVGPNGVGSGPESAAIDLIYYFLLPEFGQNIYSYISINQIGDDLNEIILKKGKDLHINLRYPTYEDFESKTTDEKNRIRLEVLHEGLLRIAAKYKELDVAKLEAIKNKIIDKNFSFEFVCKQFQNTRKKKLAAKIIVRPKPDRFDYFVSIEDGGKEICNLLIYSGLPSIHYFPDLFRYGKWMDQTKFIITGKAKSAEIHISVNDCKVEYVNLTPYEKAPYFEMMKADLTEEERLRVGEDYNHSLPPHIAAAIRESKN